MLMSRAELAGAFRLKASSSSGFSISGQDEAQRYRDLFLKNEDNQKLLDAYKAGGYKSNCYVSKANSNDVYVIVSPRFSASHAFKITDPQTGAAKEIYGDETPIGRAAKFYDALKDAYQLAGALSRAANNVIDNPLRSLPTGESHHPDETDPMNGRSFLDRKGSSELSFIIGEIAEAKKHGKDYNQLSRDMEDEISSIVQAGKLQAEIKKIESDYIITTAGA